MMMIELLTLFFSISCNNSISTFSYKTDLSFINFGFNFQLGGLSIGFCLLTSILIFICILLIWDKPFFVEQAICLFFLQFFVIGAFTSTNLFYFYVFFESVVIPMYIMIVLFGSRNRKIRAANLLFYYTLVSSAMLLLSIGGLYAIFGTTDFELLMSDQGISTLPPLVQNFLWVVFFLLLLLKCL